jgi:hypothetical protein
MSHFDHTEDFPSIRDNHEKRALRAGRNDAERSSVLRILREKLGATVLFNPMFDLSEPTGERWNAEPQAPQPIKNPRPQ